MSPPLANGRPSIESASRRGGPGIGFLLLIPSLLGAAVLVSYRIRSSGLFRWTGGLDWWQPPLEPPAMTTLAAALLVLPALALAVRSSRSFAPATALPAILAFLLAQGPLPSPFDSPAGLLHLLSLPATRARALPMAGEAGAAALGLFAAATALERATRRLGPAEVAHGTARLATLADLRAADLLSGEGIVLGAHRTRLGLRPITDRSGDHVLAVMPPGGGKTTGPVAGTLLNVGGSALVLDPKGELWSLTSSWRDRGDRQVIRFAPHSASTRRWNPLDEITLGAGEVAAISALADNLVTYPATEHGDNHWTASARALLRCLILHVLYTDHDHTFASVRDLLMSTTDFDRFFKDLSKANHDESRTRRLRDSAGESTRTHPEVARLARLLAATPKRERGSVISTLTRFLDLWGDPHLRESTRCSDWSLSKLTDPSSPTTVYVTVPTNQLVRIAPLLRMLLALLTHRITADTGGFRDHETRNTEPLYLVLDEYAALGRIPLLEDMLAFLRGYGVRALIAVQDLSQLRRIYGPHHAIAANCRLHVAAASSDVATRAEISRRLGDATHVYTKRSRSGRLLDARRTVSQAEVRRPLLTEGEVGALPPDKLLVTKAGHPPILADKLPYWRHSDLLRRTRRPPVDDHFGNEARRRRERAAKEPS
jgi:type IV secretion system protein VirD4